MKTILILTANSTNTDRLQLDAEVRQIEDALQRSQFRDRFQVKTQLATRTKDLRRALLEDRPHIVHFSGHGAGEKGIVLENDAGQMQLVSIDALASLFGVSETVEVECVLLNACYSEIQAKEIHQYVDCVIGMNQPIGDKAAILFAEGFYDALGAGRSYQEAFNEGCIAIRVEGNSEYSTPKLLYRQRGNEAMEQAPVEPISKPEPGPSPPTQSIVISGGTVSGQFGQAGRDLTQTQYQIQGEPEKQVSTEEVIQLITQIESLLRSSTLLKEQKDKAIRYLESAKEEASNQEPDKQFAATNLQKATSILKETNEVVGAGQSLWATVAPLLGRLIPWLGVASHFFGL